MQPFSIDLGQCFLLLIKLVYVLHSFKWKWPITWLLYKELDVMDVKMWEMFGSEGRQRQENILEIMADSLLLSSIFPFCKFKSMKLHQY